jgi:nucleoid-associated protein YgaU
MDAAAVVEPKTHAPVEGVAEVKGPARTSAVKEDTIVNRETKLALLIGFVAIVVVTVLVGEHFGKARNANLATTELGTSQAAAPSASGLTVDPITSSTVGTPSAPLTQPVSLNMGGTTGGAVTPVGGAAPSPTAGSMSGGTPLVNSDPNRFMPAAGVDSTPLVPRGATGNEVPGTHPVNGLGDPAATTGTNSPALGGKPVSSGVEKMHPVQRGETVASLAQKYYSDKSLSKQLSAYNAKRLSSSGTLHEGVTLRIPPKDVLMGTAVLSPASAGRTDGTAFAPEAPAPKAKTDKATAEKTLADKASPEKPKSNGARTYVIKKGDTLMTIAAKELGSAKRWESLLVANPSLDENSLRAGMTIKIPATK